MIETNPIDSKEMEQKNNLELISTFHYVWGGLKLFAALFVLIYVILGAGMLVGGTQTGEVELMMTGGIFLVVGLFGTLIVVALGIMSILCGKYLREHRNRMFCLVMSGLACANAPLGTILGIFTILEIEKPEIKKEFEENEQRIKEIKKSINKK